ncbi:hypothetical protein HZB90_02210, partial [archaeon]|nr:hypothetical protein [archaeon]
DYVVTDLPYGKNSRLTDGIEKVYSRFLDVLWDILRYKAVLIFPSFIDHHEIIAKTKFIIENEFNIYVHRSLSRNIVVLARPGKQQ